MIPHLNVNQQRLILNTRATHFSEMVYLKQRQVYMLRLVFKKLNLCPGLPASRGGNPLATALTAEHLSGICLHSWSQEKSILFLVSHCLNKIDIAWTPWRQSFFFFFLILFQLIYFRPYLGYGQKQTIFYLFPIFSVLEVTKLTLTLIF